MKREFGTISPWHRKRLRSRWVAAFILASFIVAGGAAAALSGGHSGFPLVVTALAFFVSVAPYAALAVTSFGRDLRSAFANRPVLVWVIPGTFILAYIGYGIGTLAFSWNALIRLSLFVAIPTLLAYISRRQKEVTWLDALTVATIWMPFDLGWLSSIWSWPQGEGAYVINTAMAVVLAANLFIGLRSFSRVSLRFALNWAELRLVASSLIGFLLLAIPFGFATDFIQWNFQIPDVKTLVGTPLGILFFIAIPEEFLFRGLVQNMLQKALGSEFKALLLASLFFGLTHLNNEPLMDWRYVTLATAAGFFYGHTYFKSRTLLAPAVVHMLVDTLWVMLFLKQ